MLKFHDIKQNTEEWDMLRCGKITSSSLCKIMAHYPKDFGDPARRYAKALAVERITGRPAGSGYSNAAMARGHEQEPLARIAYENEFFCDVKNGGFFCSDTIGCSPDGLVGDDGLIEIKSAEPHIHYDRVAKQSIDSAYKWQIVGNLLFTGREWIDFVSYCQSFPEDRKLYTCRVNSNDFKKEFGQIESRIAEFSVLIDSIQEKIETANYFIY